MKKKGLTMLGLPVIFFPALSDRECMEGGYTECAAMICHINEGDDGRVNLRVFNHATSGQNVPLRTMVAPKELNKGQRPYYMHLNEYHDMLEESMDKQEEAQTEFSNQLEDEQQNNLGANAGANSGIENLGNAIQNGGEKDDASNNTTNTPGSDREIVDPNKNGADAANNTGKPPVDNGDPGLNAGTGTSEANDTVKSLQNGEGTTAAESNNGAQGSEEQNSPGSGNGSATEGAGTTGDKAAVEGEGADAAGLAGAQENEPGSSATQENSPGADSADAAGSAGVQEKTPPGGAANI